LSEIVTKYDFHEANLIFVQYAAGLLSFFVKIFVLSFYTDFI
jgi:hypothetical protein